MLLVYELLSKADAALYAVLRSHESFSSIWPASTVIVVEFVLLTALPTLSALWLVQRVFERKGIKSFFGISTRKWRPHLASGVGIGSLMFLCFVGFAWITGNYQILGIKAGYPSISILWLVSVVTVGVISEEALFRGYILPTLEQRFGTGTALAVTTSLFAVGHGRFGQGNVAELVVHPIVHALALGALLGAAYLVSRTIWLPIGIHFAWNFLGAVFFNSRTYGIKSLIRYSYYPYAFDLTGVAFCGSVAICCLTAFVLLLYARQKNCLR